MSNSISDRSELTAQKLGLNSFHLNHHGQEFVDHLWYAEINATFKGSATIGVARAIDLSKKNNPVLWFRGCFLLLGDFNYVHAFETIDLKSDLLLSLNPSISLFDKGDTFSRDGVSYTMKIPHHDGSVTLQFANPETSPLIDIESRLKQMGRKIAGKSTNTKIQEFLSFWDPD